MKRRAFFTGLLAAVTGESQSRDKVFYITGGHRPGGYGDCDVPPIVTHGKDRLDAIANSGMTVWTENEWGREGVYGFMNSAGCVKTRSFRELLRRLP